MALLVYGVTGLTTKELDCVTTAFGFGIRAILCSFIGIMVVLVVDYVFVCIRRKLGALPGSIWCPDNFNCFVEPHVYRGFAG